jgi:hypothetical protein
MCVVCKHVYRYSIENEYKPAVQNIQLKNKPEQKDLENKVVVTTNIDTLYKPQHSCWLFVVNEVALLKNPLTFLKESKRNNTGRRQFPVPTGTPQIPTLPRNWRFRCIGGAFQREPSSQNRATVIKNHMLMP